MATTVDEPQRDELGDDEPGADEGVTSGAQLGGESPAMAPTPGGYWDLHRARPPIPPARLPRAPTAAGPRDEAVRFVRARPRPRHRRSGYLIFIAGLTLLALGLGILIAGLGHEHNTPVVSATAPVAQVAQGTSTVLIGHARAGSQVQIAALNTHVNLLSDKFGTWTLPVPVYPGQNRFTATYTDVQGHRKSTLYLVTVPLRAATTPLPTTGAPVSTIPATALPSTAPSTAPITAPAPLVLTITTPTPGTRIAGSRIFIIGTATSGATITGAGLATTTDPTGVWSLSVALLPGNNYLQFTATARNAQPKTISILVVSIPPTQAAAAPSTTPSTAPTTTCCPPDTVP